MIWTKLQQQWDIRFAPLMSPSRADWIFALRTTAAGLIALLVAYALDLDHPQWAMMTVFIVAQPIAGMVLAKGFFRLFGTLAGALAAIAITSAFGTSPWLFVSLLALWVGLCTMVSSLLRNPEAYGAALAGYTAMIIGLPAFGNPHLVTDLAVARCAEIVVGIICAAATSRFILPQLARDAIGSRLKRCILDLAAYANGAFSRDDTVKLEALYRKLIADTQTLAEMRAYARLEAPSVATRAYPVRRTIGHLLSALSAARTLYTHAAPLNAALKPVRDELRTVVSELSTAPDDLNDTQRWIGRLDAVERSSHIVPDAENDPDSVGTFTRLTIAGEFAEALKESLRGLDALRVSGARSKREPGKQPPLVVHRDHHGAYINAVRATVATVLVAGFWLATQWTNAAGAVIIVAVVTSLFASRPNPVQVAWGFFKGTLLALPFAFVLGQLVLPLLPGFGWFALLVTPVLVATALAMANPPYVGIATAFAINFLAFLSPHRVMTYDPQEFFVGAGSVLIGILLATGVFSVLFPARAITSTRRIVAAMREDLIRLCLHERLPRRSAFESLAYDRVNQLLPLLPGAGRKGEALFGGSIAAVTVGLEVLRLRKDRQAQTIPAEVSQSIENFMKVLAHDLLKGSDGEGPAKSVADARLRSADIAAGHEDAAMMQVAASLRIIAAAIEDYPAFFARKTN